MISKISSSHKSSMRDGHVITKTFADALWSWRKVKTQTDTVSSSIDKGLVQIDHKCQVYICKFLELKTNRIPCRKYVTDN